MERQFPPSSELKDTLRSSRVVSRVKEIPYLRVYLKMLEKAVGVLQKSGEGSEDLTNEIDTHLGFLVKEFHGDTKRLSSVMHVKVRFLEARKPGAWQDSQGFALWEELLVHGPPDSTKEHYFRLKVLHRLCKNNSELERVLRDSPDTLAACIYGDDEGLRSEALTLALTILAESSDNALPTGWVQSNDVSDDDLVECVGRIGKRLVISDADNSQNVQKPGENLLGAFLGGKGYTKPHVRDRQVLSFLTLWGVLSPDGNGFTITHASRILEKELEKPDFEKLVDDSKDTIIRRKAPGSDPTEQWTDKIRSRVMHGLVEFTSHFEKRGERLQDLPEGTRDALYALLKDEERSSLGPAGNTGGSKSLF